MQYLDTILDGNSVSDIRAALYYAVRYIKQAESFERYQKDIFEDEERSAPSESVRSLALGVISSVEIANGAKAASFSDDLVVEILDGLSTLEDSLDEVSGESLAAASAFIKGVKTPKVRE